MFHSKNQQQFLSTSFTAFENIPSPEVTAKLFVKNFVEDDLSHLLESAGVALIDGSGSTGTCQFRKGNTALSYLMDSASESNPTIDTTYTAITFASSATVNFDFLQNDKAAKAIKTIPYPSGSTNIQAALDEALKLFKNRPPLGTVLDIKG